MYRDKYFFPSGPLGLFSQRSGLNVKLSGKIFSSWAIEYMSMLTSTPAGIVHEPYTIEVLEVTRWLRCDVP